VFAAIAVIGAPVVEELFFRGLLLRALTTAMGVPGAIAVQALLFGVAHFSPILGLASVSVMTVVAAAGVIFGITAWWRRVGTSVAAHAFFNLIAVLIAAFVEL
jgi:membrane protease YdiL (CAAX protease family)